MTAKLSALEAFARDVVAMPLVAGGIFAFPASLVVFAAGVGHSPILAPAVTVGGMALGAAMLATGAAVSSFGTEERRKLVDEREIGEATADNAAAMSALDDEASALLASGPKLSAA